MTANTAIQYVNKLNNRKGGWGLSGGDGCTISGQSWIQRAADLKETAALVFFLCSLYKRFLFVYDCIRYSSHWVPAQCSVHSGLACWRNCLCLRMSVWRDCRKLNEAMNTCLPARAHRNSLHEYAKPNFKPTAGELWLHFPSREHERRSSTMPVCHTFKHC